MACLCMKTYSVTLDLLVDLGDEVYHRLSICMSMISNSRNLYIVDKHHKVNRFIFIRIVIVVLYNISNTRDFMRLAAYPMA